MSVSRIRSVVSRARTVTAAILIAAAMAACGGGNTNVALPPHGAPSTAPSVAAGPTATPLGTLCGSRAEALAVYANGCDVMQSVRHHQVVVVSKTTPAQFAALVGLPMNRMMDCDPAGSSASTPDREYALYRDRKGKGHIYCTQALASYKRAPHARSRAATTGLAPATIDWANQVISTPAPSGAYGPSWEPAIQNESPTNSGNSWDYVGYYVAAADLYAPSGSSAPSDFAGTIYPTVWIYRLHASDADYFLLVGLTETTPHYVNCGWGIDCLWYTQTQQFNLTSAQQLTPFLNEWPTSAIPYATSQTTTFLGQNFFGIVAPGVTQALGLTWASTSNAYLQGYATANGTLTWNTAMNVGTSSQSSLPTEAQDECCSSLGMYFYGLVTMPNSSGNALQIQHSGQASFYDDETGFSSNNQVSTPTANASYYVLSPTFSLTPAKVPVSVGGPGSASLIAEYPGWTTQIPWQMSGLPSWLNASGTGDPNELGGATPSPSTTPIPLANATTYTGNYLLSFTANGTLPPAGTTATISFNTYPAYGADSVNSGPLTITVCAVSCP